MDMWHSSQYIQLLLTHISYFSRYMYSTSGAQTATHRHRPSGRCRDRHRHRYRYQVLGWSTSVADLRSLSAAVCVCLAAPPAARRPAARWPLLDAEVECDGDLRPRYPCDGAPVWDRAPPAVAADYHRSGGPRFFTHECCRASVPSGTGVARPCPASSPSDIHTYGTAAAARCGCAISCKSDGRFHAA